MDLFQPEMLPKGTVLLPEEGIGKCVLCGSTLSEASFLLFFSNVDAIACEYGIDFAKAVHGFEFRRGRSFPLTVG